MLCVLVLVLLEQEMVTKSRDPPCGCEHEGCWRVGVGGALGIDVGYTGALLADEWWHRVVVVDGGIG